MAFGLQISRENGFGMKFKNTYKRFLKREPPVIFELWETQPTFDGRSSLWIRKLSFFSDEWLATARSKGWIKLSFVVPFSMVKQWMSAKRKLSIHNSNGGSFSLRYLRFAINFIISIYVLIKGNSQQKGQSLPSNCNPWVHNSYWNWRK